MRTRAFATGLAVALACAPVAAQNEGGGLEKFVTGENVGRLLGAGAGALLGSQVGGGKGKLAAVAVGTLAGFWLGGEVGKRLTKTDHQGIAQTTQTALETGEDQSWQNPDTGVQTDVAVKERTVVSRPEPMETDGLKSAVWEAPTMMPVNAFYVANRTSNVRGGPGTDYAVMDQIERGDRIPVVGKVAGADWYMIADGGYGHGFVHAPLLDRDDAQPPSGNALRVAARRTSTSRVARRECALIDQQITLPDGTGESREIRACQRSDGTWEAV